MDLIDKALRLLFLPFKIPDVIFKKQVFSTLRKALLWVKHVPRELGGCGFGFVETLSPGDPVFLIGSNYSPLSTDVFQWNHLFWGPSVKGSLVVGCLLNIFAANVSREKKTKEKHPKE